MSFKYMPRVSTVISSPLWSIPSLLSSPWSSFHNDDFDDAYKSEYKIKTKSLLLHFQM